jgi:hypothetical protein
MARTFLYILLVALLLACGGAVYYGGNKNAVPRLLPVGDTLSVGDMHLSCLVEKDAGKNGGDVLELSYDLYSDTGDSVFWAEGVIRVPLSSLDSVGRYFP